MVLIEVLEDDVEMILNLPLRSQQPVQAYVLELQETRKQDTYNH